MQLRNEEQIEQSIANGHAEAEEQFRAALRASLYAKLYQVDASELRLANAAFPVADYGVAGSLRRHSIYMQAREEAAERDLGRGRS